MEAAADFFIEIVQSTSDEGRGLLHHVEVDLGAHHSPHVFHAQQELPKGTSGALASKTRQAERTVAEATEQVSAHQEAEDAERPQELAEQLAQAQEQEQMALQVLETAMAQQERARQTAQGISVAYHPARL